MASGPKFDKIFYFQNFRATLGLNRVSDVNEINQNRLGSIHHLSFKQIRGKLFGGTVPPNNFLFGGTVPPNKFLFGGTCPAK